MKKVLESFLDREVWLMLSDKWIFVQIKGVEDEVVYFTHRTYSKETEAYQLWETCAALDAINAIDRITQVVSARPEDLFKFLRTTDTPGADR